MIDSDNFSNKMLEIRSYNKINRPCAKKRQHICFSFCCCCGGVGVAIQCPFLLVLIINNVVHGRRKNLFPGGTRNYLGVSLPPLNARV